MEEEKREMLNRLKLLRKRYGNGSVHVYKMIYRIVQKFPYHEYSEQTWLRNNGRKLEKRT